MFNSLHQYIINGDYGNVYSPLTWNMQTLTVFIPGVSLMIQKIKISDISRILKDRYKEPICSIPEMLKDHSYRKLENICEWHVLGSVTQIIYLFVLSLFNPLFFIPCTCSFYNLYRALDENIHRIFPLNNEVYVKIADHSIQLDYDNLIYLEGEEELPWNWGR
jgi:hypothetical protein